MTSRFTITPTPPTSIKVRPGEQGQLSFTVTCDLAPDTSLDVAFAASLIGGDGKGKEVDWLVVGPRQSLRVFGGQTETITISARPRADAPHREHTIKLVIVDKDQPNEIYGESSPVLCEVVGPTVDTTTTTTKTPWWRSTWVVVAAVGGFVVVGGLLVFMLVSGGDDPPGVGQPCSNETPTCKAGLVCEPIRRLCLAPEGAACTINDDCVTANCRANVCAPFELPGLREPCRLDANPACRPGLVCDPDRKLCLTPEGSACTSAEDCITAKCRGNVCIGADLEPSNGLAQFLDLTPGEPALDLGAKATLNTDDGTVTVDNRLVNVRSATLAQAGAPTIRVFIVRSLHAADVTVTGTQALAIVSHGDIKIDGTFAASGHDNVPGAGAFNQPICQGASGGTVSGGGFGGSGGGGFGSPGARGGSATTTNGAAAGGLGGGTAGTASLVPLRGGCNSGTYAGSGSVFGAGGGAIQPVSRTKIAVVGVVAANGASMSGGGSGGGLLLEAPAIDISGNVVANGGAGAGGRLLPRAAEDGRLDATPAKGGTGCDPQLSRGGGDGAAGTSGARSGGDINVTSLNSRIALGGHAGGGVGRIRINTASGGLKITGLFSPNPTTGTIVPR
jgi:hypothetical protein